MEKNRNVGRMDFSLILGHLLLPLLLFIAIYPIHSNAQELTKMFVVGTADTLNDGIVRNTTENRDRDGYLCAVISIVSDLMDLKFDSNTGIIRIVDDKPGEYNLYLNQVERKISVYKDGYERLDIILSQYGISKLEGGKVWQLKITGNKKAKAVTGTGTLILTSNPSGAKISVEGLPINNAVTPYTFNKILPITYLLKLEKSRHVTADTTMVITKDKTDSFDVKLIPLFGNVTIVSEPAGADILVDGVEKGKTPLNLFGETYGLDTGSHEITLNYNGTHRDAYTPYKETIQLKAGETVTVNPTFEPKMGLLSISSNQTSVAYKITDIETNDIIYDEPYDPNKQVIIGNYRIEAISPGYVAITKEVNIIEGSNPPIVISFTDNQREEFIIAKERKHKTFTKSLVIPGTGQWYAGKKGKGALITTLQLAAIGGAAASTIMLIEAGDEYDKARSVYKNSTTLDEINRTSKDAEIKYDKAASMSILQKGTIGAAVGIYLWNVIDAAFTKPYTETETHESSIKLLPIRDGILLSMRF